MSTHACVARMLENAGVVIVPSGGRWGEATATGAGESPESSVGRQTLPKKTGEPTPAGNAVILGVNPGEKVPTCVGRES